MRDARSDSASTAASFVGMELRDTLRTTGAARAFTDQSVDDATLAAILDDARFAPSGGNRQPWRVAVVKDVSLRRQLGGLMQPIWDDYVAQAGTGVTPFTVVTAGVYDMAPQIAGGMPNALLDNIESIPVVLLVAVDLGKVSMMDKDLGRATVVGGASIYPFCWSVMLAARERGLGGVLTTFLSRAEHDAAPLVDLPEGFALAATIFLGYPTVQPTKLSRKPVRAFATVDTFTGPKFSPSG